MAFPNPAIEHTFGNRINTLLSEVFVSNFIGK